MISEFIFKTGIQIEYLVAFIFMIQIKLFLLVIGVKIKNYRQKKK